METRANYVLVGIFTVAAVATAFLFVYWTGRFGNTSNNVPIIVSIPGSAAGLDTGSRILFNGIRIGVVRSVTLDATNPEIAVATGVVNRNAPIKPSTNASIAVATLSGTADIELTGGDPEEQNRLALLPEDAPEIITITAQPSAFNDILASVQSMLDRADVIFTGVESVMQEGREPIINTLKNTETFSAALADGSGDIATLMTSVKSLADTASALSTRLEGTVDAAETLIRAVEPEKIGNIVGNVELITGKLERATDDISIIVEDAGDAVAAVKAGALTAQNLVSALDATRVNTILDNTEQLTKTANNAASKLDQTLSAFNSEDVNKIIGDANATMASIRQTVKSLEGTVDQDQIGRVIGSIEIFTGRLERASAEFDGIAIGVGKLTDNALGIATRADNVLRNAETLISAVKPENITNITTSIEKAAAQAERAASSVAKAGDAAAELSKIVTRKTPEIEKTIEQTSQFMGRINAASVRIDGILAKFDSLLGSGDTQDIASNLGATLEAYRRLAITLNGRVAQIADGLSQFTNTGLKDIQRLAAESRTTLQRVERSVDSLARNPQRIITGGEGQVRRFEGQRQRR